MKMIDTDYKQWTLNAFGKLFKMSNDDVPVTCSQP